MSHARFHTLTRRANLLWLAAYLVYLAGVVALVFWARRTTLREMDTPEARAAWTTWREAPTNQSGDGPVRRRAPTSTEPPALVLVRDYFSVVMCGAIVFGSLLFAALMLAARGVMSSGH
jgi:hypothetical protein